MAASSGQNLKRSLYLERGTSHRRFETDQEIVYIQEIVYEADQEIVYEKATAYTEGRIPSNYAFLNSKCPWRHNKQMRKNTHENIHWRKPKTSTT